MTALMDYKLACEYREVAVRSSISVRQKTQQEIELILDALEAVAEPVLVWAKIRPLRKILATIRYWTFAIERSC